MASVVLPKCEHTKYTKYILMMGNIGRPLARYYVKIGNIQNIFYMMGYSKLKLTFMLYLWAGDKRIPYLEQLGDHTQSEWNGMEWNDQGCLVGKILWVEGL